MYIFSLSTCYLFTSTYFWLQVYDRKSQRLVEELIDKKIVLSMRAIYQSKIGLGLMDIGMRVFFFPFLLLERNLGYIYICNFTSHYSLLWALWHRIAEVVVSVELILIKMLLVIICCADIRSCQHFFRLTWCFVSRLVINNNIISFQKRFIVMHPSVTWVKLTRDMGFEEIWVSNWIWINFSICV